MRKPLYARASGEKLDKVATDTITSVCIPNEFDGKEQLPNETCVYDMSQQLRQICVEPKLLGSKWLIDKKPQHKYEEKLLRLLEVLYQRKTEEREAEEKEKRIGCILNLRKEFVTGELKLRKEVTVPEKFKELMDIFLTSNDRGVRDVLRFRSDFTSELLHEFCAWLSANLVNSFFID